jgi:hypothetical protein
LKGAFKEKKEATFLQGKDGGPPVVEWHDFKAKLIE